MNINSFMPIDKFEMRNSKKMQNSESFYQVVEGQKDPEKTNALRLQQSRQTIGKNFDQMTCQAITDSFINNVMKFDQNS